MLSKQEIRDEKILKTVQTFLDYHCRVSDQELSKILNFPASTIGRYLTSQRTKELIGVDNFAYIKKERTTNKLIGRKKGGSKKIMTKAVYIHIPFCKNICSYCSFCKVYYHEKKVDQYLESLKTEIKTFYQQEKISTIYIGGGTPSDLSLEQLKYLLDIIKLFKKEENYEFTFECNFDITKEKLQLLKEKGVNRLSFGIETTHSKYLKILNRVIDKKEIISKIFLCRQLGFDNINGDLMYAFKGEKISELEEDLDFLLSLNLEHISTYSLMIEEHTKLYLNHTENCDEKTDSKMYYTIHHLLKKHNYEHYEVSNFSKKNYRSKHNMTYWYNSEYYGFGLGAAGYINRIRYSNTRSFQHYFSGKYRYEEEKIDKESQICYELILGLRTIDGVNQKKFFKKYHTTIEEEFSIDDLIKDNNLIKINDRIYIPYDKWYVMNHILERFVR